jgi:predicted RNA-binding protein with RPS1 domain
MQEEYVADPNDVLKVGDRVDVTVLDVDRKKRQFRLSMKQADYSEEDEEAEIELPTAMEVALREAMEDSPPEPTEATMKDKPTAKQSSQELDDILSRTLSNKVKTGTESSKEKDG